GLVHALRPFAGYARLRYEHEIGAGQSECPHVLGKMAVVADRDADRAGASTIDGSTGVAGRVVALLMKTGILGDVHHARDAEEGAVGVDDGRAVEGTGANALEEVHHHDEPQLARGALNGAHGGSV